MKRRLLLLLIAGALGTVVSVKCVPQPEPGQGDGGAASHDGGTPEYDDGGHAQGDGGSLFAATPTRLLQLPQVPTWFPYEDSDGTIRLLVGANRPGPSPSDYRRFVLTEEAVPAADDAGSPIELFSRPARLGESEFFAFAERKRPLVLLNDVSIEISPSINEILTAPHSALLLSSCGSGERHMILSMTSNGVFGLLPELCPEECVNGTSPSVLLGPDGGLTKSCALPDASVIDGQPAALHPTEASGALILSMGGRRYIRFFKASNAMDGFDHVDRQLPQWAVERLVASPSSPGIVYLDGLRASDGGIARYERFVARAAWLPDGGISIEEPPELDGLTAVTSSLLVDGHEVLVAKRPHPVPSLQYQWVALRLHDGGTNEIAVFQPELVSPEQPWSDPRIATSGSNIIGFFDMVDHTDGGTDQLWLYGQELTFVPVAP